MIAVSSLRYFLVVTPPPFWLRACLLVAVISGVWMLALDPRSLDSGLASVLFLQTFAVSNGFMGSAARGHFDPLLVGARTRVSVALAHLAAAGWPGALAWCALTLVALASGGAAAAAASTPQRHLALVAVTLIGWGAGVAMPRLGAGALWTMALAGAALWRESLTGIFDLLQRGPVTPADVVTSGVAVAFCPYLLLGHPAAANDWRVLMVAAGVAALAAAAGTSFIARRQYPLTEPA